MFWFRVDNRLVHGQVIEAWLPYLHIRELVVVNDALALDELQQQIMQLAIPARVEITFVPVVGVKALYEHLNLNDVPTLFLLAGCLDVRRLIELGISVPILNVGNMHYERGKRQLCTHVAASEEDIACLRFLEKRGTTLDFRCVPGDVPVMGEWR